MPIFTFPAAFVALAGIPALAAVYLMHNRFRNRTVSSLFLWESAARAKQGGRKIERMRMPLLFFLELFIICLLVAAAVDPRRKVKASAFPMAIVLDDSISMTAGIEEDTSRSRALDKIFDEIRSFGPSEVRLYFAGATVTAGPPLKEKADIRAALEKWTCRSNTADLARGISLATDLSGREARILLVSDSVHTSLLGGRIKTLATGKNRPNAGIINAARSTGEEGTDRCLLELFNSSSSEMRTGLTISDGKSVIKRELLTLQPRQTKKLVYAVPSDAFPIHAKISHDALSADNSVFLLPETIQRIRIRNAVEDPALAVTMEKVVNATGLRSQLTDSPRLVLTDSPLAADENSWVFQVHKADPEKAVSYVGPFVVDHSHPLADGVQLEGVVWSAEEQEQFDGVPIVTAGNVPLLTEERKGDFRIFHLYVNPELSTLTQTSNWPALFWNLLNMRADHLPGPERLHVRLGSSVGVTVPPETKVTLKRVDVESQEKEYNVSGSFQLTPPETGLYLLNVGDDEFPLVCNALAKEETDLSTCNSGTEGTWYDSETVRYDYAGTAWIFGFLAIPIILLHLFLQKRSHAGNG